MIVEIEFDNKKKGIKEKRMYFEVRCIQVKKEGERDEQDVIRINGLEIKA